MELRTHWVLLFALVSCERFCKSHGQDMSQTRGWPKKLDTVYKKVVQEEYHLFRTVTHTEKVKFDFIINAIRFWDVWKNGAWVWMKSEPPFRETVFTITSRNSRGFKFNVEIFYDMTTFRPG